MNDNADNDKKISKSFAMKTKDFTLKRYDRLSFLYDFIESPLEYFRFASWRKKLEDRIVGPRALEVGVGAGKNLRYYPKKIEITVIDFSPGMLKRARKKASTEDVRVALIEMDVQQLDFRIIILILFLPHLFSARFPIP